MKIKTKVILTGMMVLCGAVISSSAGEKPTALFLTEPVDARSIGMGEAHVAAVQDAAALFWNPAAFAVQESVSVHLSNGVLPESITQQLVAVGGQAGAFGWGFGVLRFDTGSITRRDAFGNDQGRLEPHDLSYAASGAYRFDWGSIGGTVKRVRLSLDDTESFFAADLGFLSSDLYDGKARVGATVTNIGSKIEFESVEESIPTELKLGGLWRWKQNVQSTLDATFPQEDDPWFATGVEWGISAGEASLVLFRAGLNSRPLQEDQSTIGFHGGLGFQLGFFNLDYAISPVQDTGLVHQGSLGFRFGGK